MRRIFENESNIIIENDYTQICISKKDATVEKILDKATLKDINSETQAPFFSLWADEKEGIECLGLSLAGDTIIANFRNGQFKIKAEAFDSYFTFELITALPADTFRAFLAHMKYQYDYTDKNNTGAVGIAMTISANPVHFPNGYAKETLFRVYPHLEDIGAKYALVIAPLKNHREILKKISKTIDPEKGIVSPTGGAWGRDARMNFSNYAIQRNASQIYIKENLDFYKEAGIEQIDLVKDFPTTYRQGDFVFTGYADSHEFKKNVSDKLEENGIATGIHTYSHYISFEASTILKHPENQRQLRVREVFTLAKDMTPDDMFIPTLESTDHVTEEYIGYSNEIPYVLIDNEIINVKKGKNGFNVCHRGHAETKPAFHKKGSTVKYLDGFYYGICPELGSELFLQIARNTAKAYNEGGFKMIYLDALDGIRHHCSNEHEFWYYCAMFIRELLKHCEIPPIMEQASFHPSFWASRGRVGAWDVCRHGYKNYNKWHAIWNFSYLDAHLAPTLGWYDYYPTDETAPGNVHIKYQHTDAVEHIGVLGIIYDYSTVFNGTQKAQLDRYPAMRRNVAINKKYDGLRRSQYFNEKYRKKLLSSPYELSLIQKHNKKYSFVEKSYKTVKLYDLSDAQRNTVKAINPFKSQAPFIRIEALLSTLGNNPMVMLPIDESKPITEQSLDISYGGYIDFSNNLAKKVKIYGNGKSGKICFKFYGNMINNPKMQMFVIDIDFKGWREFTLIESDNGERTDHSFDKGESDHCTYRSPFNHAKTIRSRVQTEGDMNGVRMSSIIAYEHVYNVMKNPTVKIGNTEIMFECELMSTEYIEFDGKSAKVIDRYGNEKPIWYKSDLKLPRGKYSLSLTAHSLNRCNQRAQITIGVTGNEISPMPTSSKN